MDAAKYGFREGGGQAKEVCDSSDSKSLVAESSAMCYGMRESKEKKFALRSFYWGL